MAQPHTGHEPVLINDDLIVGQAATALKLSLEGAKRAIELLDGGATVPFIARYRKEVTGGLDEEQLRQLEKRVAYGRQLAQRKIEVLASIEEQGQLNPGLAASIQKAATLQEVEDFYLPFRPKRRTRATIAREKGLAPLADLIGLQRTFKGQPSEYARQFVDAGRGVENVEQALAGARDIVAERIAEDAELRRRLRRVMSQQAVLKSSLAKGAKDESRKYEQYYDYSEPLSRIPPHRRLALNRAEKEGVLSVKVELAPALAEQTALQLYPLEPRSIFKDELRTALTDGLKRLALPSIENEVRAALSEEAESHAIRIFAANLRQLLLQPPIRGQVVLGIDPGFRTGCKLAVVDPTGKLLANGTIYPHEPQNDRAGSTRTLLELIGRYKVGLLAIGNGTASRETETLAASVIAACPEPRPAYIMVSEAGASVYSASDLARQEFPNLDATQRGNISIARRLQDPLAELVKIDPKSIGVGLYQHDVDQKQLSQSLDAVVESCVNYVGVDLNTASAALLRYVSGVNKKVADAIVVYREKNGPFKTRRELQKVPGLGDKTFEQAAGFLKIAGGSEPLDNTFIHPESYVPAGKLLKLLAGNAKSLPGAPAVKEFRSQTLSDEQKLAEVAAKVGLGTPTLRDILDNLEKPGRDPREELPKPILRQDILKLEDLVPGMVLQGTVRNVIDFGAFVDIGLKHDGLVHITEMSERYVKHPLEVVSVGDIVNVRVLQIDRQRGRVSLSLKLEGGSSAPIPA